MVDREKQRKRKKEQKKRKKLKDGDELIKRERKKSENQQYEI